jgi:hypothetical protein
LLERGAECALLVVWTELEPELVACKLRKDVKMDVDEAFAVREEETDAAASGYAVPQRARAGTQPPGTVGRDGFGVSRAER